jgi:hypothetical protein
MAVLGVAWLPIGLPLLLLGFIAQHFDKRLGTILIGCGIWPLLGMRVMWSATFGNWTGAYYRMNSEVRSFAEMQNCEIKLIVPTKQMLAQGIGIAMTALAVAATAAMVILFLTTVLFSPIVLGTVLAACGTVALIGLIAFGIARQCERGTTLFDLTKGEKNRLSEKLRDFGVTEDLTYENLSNAFASWDKFERNMSQIEWDNALGLIKLLPGSLIECLIFLKKGFAPALFEHCCDGAILSQVLKIFQRRSSPDVIRNALEDSNNELRRWIMLRANRDFDGKVGLALDKLLKYAGMKSFAHWKNVYEE